MDEWLSGFGSVLVVDLYAIRDRQGQRKYSKHLHQDLTIVLRNAEENPLVDLNAITTKGYMEYLMSLHRLRHGRLLGKSVHGDKYLALFYLFCLHYHCRFLKDSCVQLGNQLKGF